MLRIKLQANGFQLPCILIMSPEPVVLVDRTQLGDCKGDLQKLDALLMTKLDKM